MKKLLVLSLALILALSLAACGGNNNPPSDNGGDNSTPPVSQGADNTPSTTIESLIDWMQGGTYYMKYIADIEYEGEKMTMKGTMAAQGDKLAVTSEMTYEGQAVKSRTVSVDGATWIIDDTTKTIMKSPVDISEVNKEMADFSAIEKVGSGTGEVNGKTLPYEEYNAEGFTVKFYMDGGKVYAIESEGEGAKAVMVIEEQSKTIPGGSFDLPEDYTKIG